MSSPTFSNLKGNGRSPGRRQKQRRARKFAQLAADTYPAATDNMPEEGEIIKPTYKTAAQTANRQTHHAPMAGASSSNHYGHNSGPQPAGAQQPTRESRTYHSTQRDASVPLPFNFPPHLQITGRHSVAPQEGDNELVFLGVLAPGQLATRETLQDNRTLVASQVRSRLGVALKLTDDNGEDPITIVTKRAPTAPDTWLLNGDVRIRFASAGSAKAVYQQQRADNRARNAAGSGHMRTHDDRRCTVIIPSGVDTIDPDNKDLHRVFVSCENFRGLDTLQLQSLLAKSLEALYHRALSKHIDPLDKFEVPDDVIGAISEAVAVASAQEGAPATLQSAELLYFMEFSRIYKQGGPNSPYASIDWPDFQIPQTIISLLANINVRLTLPLVNDEGTLRDAHILFYDRNPAGRGLDFDDNPADREPFMRYSVNFRCLNPPKDLASRTLPPLEDVSEALQYLLRQHATFGTDGRRQLDNTLSAAGVLEQWFPPPSQTSAFPLDMNIHLGAHGLMTPGRIQDVESARLICASFRHAAGAVLAVHKSRFLIYTYYDSKERLRLDHQLTAGHPSIHTTEKKYVLIYEAHPSHGSSLTNMPAKPTRQDRIKWINGTLDQVPKSIPIDLPSDPGTPFQFRATPATAEDMEGQETAAQAPHPAVPAPTGAVPAQPTETPIAPAAPAARNHPQPRGSDAIRTPPSTGQRHGRSKSRSRSPSAVALRNRFASLRDGTDQSSSGDSRSTLPSRSSSHHTGDSIGSRQRANSHDINQIISMMNPEEREKLIQSLRVPRPHEQPLHPDAPADGLHPELPELREQLFTDGNNEGQGSTAMEAAAAETAAAAAAAAEQQTPANARATDGDGAAESPGPAGSTRSRSSGRKGRGSGSRHSN